MPSADDLKQRIEASIPESRAEVQDLTGGGDHFRATVVSSHFSGLSRIEQHRLIYAAVRERMDDGSIHALSLKTSALEEAETR